ncbi:hypothetical protein CR66_09220 [Campylobacter mucosalis]|uniref:hypothetical protein n=1 Tax=Campylobacter mucosalis TaxID=202 RepID=UPI0004D9104F|nr:hypothetical protein [Campylobacter mucosalis]KEA45218.1 hypothetical protein CR66_09220 [Campylobacter mucosalis]
MQEKIITAFKTEFDKITNQKTQKYAHKIFFPAIMVSQPCFIVTDKIFYAMREWYMGGRISGELNDNEIGLITCKLFA